MDAGDATAGSGVLKLVLHFFVVVACHHVLVQSVGTVERGYHFVVGYLPKGESVKRVGEIVYLEVIIERVATAVKVKGVTDRLGDIVTRPGVEPCFMLESFGRGVLSSDVAFQTLQLSARPEI